MVEADIESRPLVNYSGEEAKIKMGMACEVRIVTKTKKILHYLREKMDLRFYGIIFLALHMICG
ncbi:hypothetical protein [Thermotalea metallivorans]|uniref:hypothetical protein n=1 Tax=Thermotalea metallivorans TaxID=520762 RepID=UPI0008383D88|nr:hypothetical protein [Thermotalea metallivorans]